VPRHYRGGRGKAPKRLGVVVAFVRVALLNENKATVCIGLGIQFQPRRDGTGLGAPALHVLGQSRIAAAITLRLELTKQHQQRAAVTPWPVCIGIERLAQLGGIP